MRREKGGFGATAGDQQKRRILYLQGLREILNSRGIWKKRHMEAFQEIRYSRANLLTNADFLVFATLAKIGPYLYSYEGHICNHTKATSVSI